MKLFNPSTEPSKKGRVKDRTKYTVWTQDMVQKLTENFQTVKYRELAKILGVTQASVKGKVVHLGLIRTKLPPRGPNREKKEPKKKLPASIRRKLKKNKATDVTERLKAESARREKARVLKTRQQDLSGMRTIRIDAKTFVYVKPGQDPDKVRRQYQRTLSKDGYSKIEF